MSDIVESGEIVAVRQDGVDVRVTATAACEQCSHCSKVDKDGVLISDVSNDAGGSLGDIVEVEIPSGGDIRAGIYAYIVPVAAVLVGYGLGNVAGSIVHVNPDLAGAAAAVAAVVASMAVMRTAANRVLASDRFRPRVRAIMSPAHPGADLVSDGIRSSAGQEVSAT